MTPMGSQKLIPALLAKDEADFRDKISNKSVRAYAPLWQIDILDGSIFDSTCWADLSVIETLNDLPDIELHLMVENPLPIIQAWSVKIPSLKRAIVHAEIERPLTPVLDQIHHLNIEAGIAFNPETDLVDYKHELQESDTILIMGVHPGASGQAFLGDPVLRSITEAKERFPKKFIAVDGGVTTGNISSIYQAGADAVCAASLIWKSDDIDVLFARGRN
jgi:ribulose-phosphate 3-epimerase